MKNNTGPSEGWPGPEADAEWFRVGAASRYLGIRGYTISARSLGRWCAEGRIPHHRPHAELGYHRRIASTTLDHVLRLSERNEAMPKGEPTTPRKAS
jgi:hypothetical protein